VHPYLQFGLSFEIYPLDTKEENLLGRTQKDAPVRREFPEGSYLFLFRKEGHVDVRYPFAVPQVSPGEVVTVRLPEAAKVPDPKDFAYIPEGPVATGGDRLAFNPIEPGTTQVGAFFISRHEVTMGEWLRFVSDKDIFPLTSADGMLSPVTKEVRAELEAIGKSRVLVVPQRRNESGELITCWQKLADCWDLADSGFHVETPMHWVSHFAAREYIAWRKREAKNLGKPWEFRLPTNLEWERVARGVDRRLYPWGDYNVWSFSWSYRGTYLGLQRAGISPFDESIFGVKDLAGSVFEHISERFEDQANYYYRGGSWELLDDVYFRAATRSSMLPENEDPSCGLRLVVEVK
jgi:serine/threonine-protein kinase